MYSADVRRIARRLYEQLASMRRVAALLGTSASTSIRTTSAVAYLLQWVVDGWGWPQGRDAPAWAAHAAVTAMAAYHRAVLGLAEGAAVTERWWNGGGYERAVVYSAMLSEYRRKRGGRELSLAPLTRTRAMFIHVDTNVFYGLLKELRMIECNEHTFREMSAEHWESVLRIPALLTARQRGYARFTGTVQTDGLAVCVHFERPTLVPAVSVTGASPRVLKSQGRKARSVPAPAAATATAPGPERVPTSVARCATDRVIGVDPDRSTLFMGVEGGREDGRYVVHKLSRRQYYVEAGMVKARHNTRVWSAGLRPALDALSKCSSKGVSLSGFAAYAATVQEQGAALWGEFLNGGGPGRGSRCTLANSGWSRGAERAMHAPAAGVQAPVPGADGGRVPHESGARGQRPAAGAGGEGWADGSRLAMV